MVPARMRSLARSLWRRRPGHRGPSPTPSPGSLVGHHRETPSAGLRTLLPSLGFFGSVDTSQLVVPLTAPCRGLLVRQYGSRPRTLQLRGVQFRSAGRVLAIDDQSASADQSSTADPRRTPWSALAMGEIRTDREPGAWWSVRFDPPLEADEALVLSRVGTVGVQSRWAQVFTLDENDAWNLAHDPAGAAMVRSTLMLLERLTGATIDAEHLADPERSAELRTRILGRLADRARSGPLTSEHEEQRLLFAVLPTRERELSPDEYTVLAHLLVGERVRVPRSASSVRSFQAVLPTSASLDRLVEHVREATNQWGVQPMMLTRHGLRDEGVLRREADEHLTLMERLTADLSDLGVPAMISYGTLLGAVREGHFLAHDDDVDMLFPVSAAEPSRGRGTIRDIAAALRARGWTVGTNPSPTSFNFHVRPHRSRIHIDLFPVFIHGGEATLHMERMQLRTIRSDLIVEPREIDLLGRTFLAPADPEGFLAERYGSGWRIPDPFHDWPWPLDSKRDETAK